MVGCIVKHNDFNNEDLCVVSRRVKLPKASKCEIVILYLSAHVLNINITFLLLKANACSFLCLLRLYSKIVS